METLYAMRDMEGFKEKGFGFNHVHLLSLSHTWF